MEMMKKGFFANFSCFFVISVLTGGAKGLEVSFNDPSVGFFVRDLSESNEMSPALNVQVKPGEIGSTTSILLGGTDSNNKIFKKAEEDISNARRFTILKHPNPVSINAHYGPFRVSQSVATKTRVFDAKNIFNVDITAHMVVEEIPKDKPQLRVLYHFGSNHHHQQQQDYSLCVRTIGYNSNVNSSEQTSTITAHCKPTANWCLAETTIPSQWWPSLQETLGVHSENIKQPKATVKVSFMVYATRNNKETCSDQDRVTTSNEVLPEERIGSVPLVLPKHGYRQLGHDDNLHMLLPQAPIYTNTNFFVPVLIENGGDEFESITIRCRARAGIRLVNAESQSKIWMIESEVNAKGTRGTVTVRKRNIEPLDKSKQNGYNGPQELFNWLFSVDESSLMKDEGKISWHVTYNRKIKNAKKQFENNISSSPTSFSTVPSKSSFVDHYKIRTRINVSKDEVQKVIPIAKNPELINLAVLNGRQVSRSLKVFIVSEAGKIADVTLKSSCSSKDDSVLKVSSSCSSVYVDGSETHGALGAEIQVKYGLVKGKISFLVWYPELPLKIELSDDKLSQIRNWKIPIKSQGDLSERMRRSHSEENIDLRVEEEKCTPRYQQTQVAIYASFFAEDSDSGRKEYFPARKLELDVTDLVHRRYLRITDRNIATLSKKTIVGQNPGRTDVQVLSPITNRVIGQREIRVTKNKESVSSIRVRLLSGIKLSLSKAEKSNVKNLFVARTSFSSKLVSKYQEALLDMELTFSDGSKVNLMDVNQEDYYLSVKSLEPGVVAYSPRTQAGVAAGAEFPRIIVVGEGSGKLLSVSLELSDICNAKSSLPLAKTNLEIDVKLAKKKEETNMATAAQAVNMGDLGDSHNIALRDDQNYYKPAVSSARHYPSGMNHHHLQQNLTPLEIGMYVLLGVFCVAIAIFVASCFVYANKFSKQDYPLQRKSRSVQNAHDWVWLGKCTIDKSSGGVSRDFSLEASSSAARPDFLSMEDSRRCQRLSYVGSEINIIPNPRTEVYEAEVSNPNSPEEIPMVERRSRQSQTANHICYELPRKRGVDVKCSTQKNDRPETSPQLPRRLNTQKQRNLPPEYRPPVKVSSPHTRRTPPQMSKATKIKINSAAFVDQIIKNDKKIGNSFQSPTTVEEKRRRKMDVSLHINPITCAPNDSDVVQHQGARPKKMINSATFTKEVNTQQIPSQPMMQSPMGLPDPSEYALSPISPLRQSPASALPPMVCQESFAELVKQEQNEDEDDDLNPDIDKPSPPRLGSKNISVLQNPFEPANEVCTPITAKNLSPNHLFEIEDMFANKEENETTTQAEGFTGLPPLRTGTFVKKSKKILSPVSSPDEEREELPELLNEDNNFDFDMNYEQLMNYFESLKESNA